MGSLSAGTKGADRHEEILECAAALYSAFERLRHGNGCRTRSAAVEAANAADSLKRHLLPDMQLEEHTLFPYIAKRVPRLEALLYYFRTEHEEFRTKLGRLCRAAAALVKGGKADDVLIDGLYFEALYLASHLKTHIHNERNELYGVISREFKDHEKKAFCELAGVTGMSALKRGRALYAVRGSSGKDRQKDLQGLQALEPPPLM